MQTQYSAEALASLDRLEIYYQVVRSEDARAWGLPMDIPRGATGALANYAAIPQRQAITDASLMAAVKRHVLSKTMHKGKLLGFVVLVGRRQPAAAEAPRALTLANLLSLPPSVTEVKLVLEYESASLGELKAAVRAKRGALAALAAAGRPVPAAVTEKLVRKLAYSSEAIEGTTVAKDEVDALLDNRPAAPSDAEGELLRHHDAIVNHVLPFGAAGGAGKTLTLADVTAELMKCVHRDLAPSTLEPADHGAYRRVAVTIRGIPNPQFTDWGRLAEASDMLFSRLHGMRRRVERDRDRDREDGEDEGDSEDAISVAAWLHFWATQHHFFRDGNGRTSRMLMNVVLLLAGYPLCAIGEAVRGIYFETLRLARREGGFQALERLIAECLLCSLDTCLRYTSEQRH